MGRARSVRKVGSECPHLLRFPLANSRFARWWARWSHPAARSRSSSSQRMKARCKPMTRGWRRCCPRLPLPRWRRTRARFARPIAKSFFALPPKWEHWSPPTANGRWWFSFQARPWALRRRAFLTSSLPPGRPVDVDGGRSKRSTVRAAGGRRSMARWDFAFALCAPRRTTAKTRARLWSAVTDR